MIDKILNFFQKNGTLKLLGAIVLAIVSLILNSHFPSLSKLWTVTAVIGFSYVVLVVLIMFGFAIKGTIEDIKDFRKNR